MGDNNEDSINNKKSPYIDSVNNASSATGERLLSKFERESSTLSKQERRTSARIDQGIENLPRLSAERQTQEVARLTKLAQSQEQNEQVRLYGAGINLRSETQTAFSGRAIERMIAHETRVADPSATIGLASRHSIFDLEAQHKKHISDVHQMSRNIVDLTARPYEEQFPTSYLEGTEQIGRSAIAAGQTASAMHYAKTMGQDRLSLAKSATADRDRYDAILGRKDIQEGVAAGKFGDREKIEKTYIDAMTKAREAADKLAKALESGSATQEESNQLLAERNVTAKEAERAAGVKKESDRLGGGGDGRSTGLQIASAVGIGLQAAGAAWRETTVNTPLQILQQRAGFADIANSRFKDVFAATQGDVSALRRMGQYANVIKSSKENFGDADIGAWMEAGGAAANATVSTIKGGLLTASVENVASSGSKTLGAIQQGAMDAANATIAGNKALRGVPQHEAVLNTFAAERALNDAKAVIPDFIQQTMLDYNQKLTLSSRGLGGNRRTTLQDQLMTSGSVDELAKLGVNLDDTARLVNAGKTALGGGLQRGDITRGARLARGGTLDSADDYLRMRGQLSNVGGSSQDMEGLLKNAVLYGMDNSKNIRQMVDATSTLAQQSVNMGISTTGGANTMMQGALEALRGSGLSKDAQNQAALAGATLTNQLTSNKDTTMGSLIFNARLRNTFGALSPIDQSTLQTTDIQTLREISQTKDNNAFIQKLIASGNYNSLGAKGNISAARANLDKAIALKIDQGSVNLTGLGVTEYSDEIRQAASNKTPYDNLRPEIKNALAQSAKASGAASGSAVYGSLIGGVGQPIGEAKTPGSSGAAKMGEATIATGAQAYARVFKDGAAQFEDVWKRQIASLQSLSPANMAAASEKAADKWDIPSEIGGFSRSVTQFGTIVDQLEKFMDKLAAEYGINKKPSATTIVNQNAVNKAGVALDARRPTSAAKIGR